MMNLNSNLLALFFPMLQTKHKQSNQVILSFSRSFRLDNVENKKMMDKGKNSFIDAIYFKLFEVLIVFSLPLKFQAKCFLLSLYSKCKWANRAMLICTKPITLTSYVK